MNTHFFLDPRTKIREEELYASTPNWLPVDRTAVDLSVLKQLPLQGCRLDLICGVSTAGKDTLVQDICTHYQHIRYLPRATSRPIRAGEVPGKSYFFSIDEPLVWSEYGGHIYAVTRQVLEQLAYQRTGVQIQGLLYGFVLKELLNPLGVDIRIIYILPQTLKDQLIGSLRVILDRLLTYHPDEIDHRLPSIIRELRFVFEYQDELRQRGVQFLINPPSSTIPKPEVVQQLLMLLE